MSPEQVKAQNSIQKLQVGFGKRRLNSVSAMLGLLGDLVFAKCLLRAKHSSKCFGFITSLTSWNCPVKRSSHYYSSFTERETEAGRGCLARPRQ